VAGDAGFRVDGDRGRELEEQEEKQVHGTVK
jgi:hypothetical protein